MWNYKPEDVGDTQLPSSWSIILDEQIEPIKSVKVDNPVVEAHGEEITGEEEDDDEGGKESESVQSESMTIQDLLEECVSMLTAEK
jgi:hypothetical protein